MGGSSQAGEVQKAVPVATADKVPKQVTICFSLQPSVSLTLPSAPPFLPPPGPVDVPSDLMLGKGLLHALL